MPGNPAPAQLQTQQQAIATFIDGVSKATGLDKNVVAAWVKVEGAYAPNGTGHFNYLNVRPRQGGSSYSGVPLAGVSSGNFQQFRSVEDAITETAHWINSFPNYAGIRQSTHVGPMSQIAAIASSPWDQGNYGGGTALYGAYKDVTSKGGGGLLSWLGNAGKTIAENPVLGPAEVGAGLAGHLPVVGGVFDTAGKVLGAPEAIAHDVGSVVGFAFNPHNWLRIGEIMFGGVLVLGGLVLLAKSVGALSITSPTPPNLDLRSPGEKRDEAAYRERSYRTSREGMSEAEGRVRSFESNVPRRPRKRSRPAARAGEGIPF